VFLGTLLQKKKKSAGAFCFQNARVKFFIKNCDTLQVPEGYPSGITIKNCDTQRVPTGYQNKTSVQKLPKYMTENFI
jgi:hypothetical protein